MLLKSLQLINKNPLFSSFSSTKDLPGQEYIYNRILVEKGVTMTGLGKKTHKY